MEVWFHGDYPTEQFTNLDKRNLVEFAYGSFGIRHGAILIFSKLP